MRLAALARRAEYLTAFSRLKLDLVLGKLRFGFFHGLSEIEGRSELPGMGSINETGEVTMYRYRIIKEGGPSQADLDNYLSADAEYFKVYRPFMRPVTRINSIGGGQVRLATETFRLELELGQWIAHLDELGFAKQPVEHKEPRYMRLLFFDGFRNH